MNIYYSDNFSSYTAGTLPPNWSNASGGAFTTRTVSPVSGPYSFGDTANVNGAQAVYSNGSAVADMAALFATVCNYTSGSASWPSPLIRAAADASAGYCCSFIPESGVLQVFRKTNAYNVAAIANNPNRSVVSALTNGLAYWQRFRATGSTLAWTIWPVGSPEPGTPTWTNTDTVVTAPGYAGIYMRRDGTAPSLPISQFLWGDPTTTVAQAPLMASSPAFAAAGSTGNAFTLTGYGTAWTAGTTASLSGGTSPSIASQSTNNSAVPQTITGTFAPGTTSGTLAFGNSTDSATAAVGVSGFGLTLATASPSVTQGLSSAGDVVTVTPLNGFTGTVALSCTGLPAGITAAFSPASVTVSSGAVTSTMTLTASNTAAVSTGNAFSVVGTGSVTTASVGATLAVLVTPTYISQLAIGGAGTTIFAQPLTSSGNAPVLCGSTSTPTVTINGTAVTLTDFTAPGGCAMWRMSAPAHVGDTVLLSGAAGWYTTSLASPFSLFAASLSATNLAVSTSYIGADLVAPDLTTPRTMQVGWNQPTPGYFTPMRCYSDLARERNTFSSYTLDGTGTILTVPALANAILFQTNAGGTNWPNCPGGGTFTMTWDGTARLGFVAGYTVVGGTMTLVSSNYTGTTSNSATYTWAPGSDPTSVAVYVSALSGYGGTVSNLKIPCPDLPAGWTDTWHPNIYAKNAGAACIRTLDFSRTNDSNVVAVADLLSETTPAIPEAPNSVVATIVSLGPYTNPHGYFDIRFYGSLLSLATTAAPHGFTTGQSVYINGGITPLNFTVPGFAGQSTSTDAGSSTTATLTIPHPVMSGTGLSGNIYQGSTFVQTFAVTTGGVFSVSSSAASSHVTAGSLNYSTGVITLTWTAAPGPNSAAVTYTCASSVAQTYDVSTTAAPTHAIYVESPTTFAIQSYTFPVSPSVTGTQSVTGTGPGGVAQCAVTRLSPGAVSYTEQCRLVNGCPGAAIWLPIHHLAAPATVQHIGATVAAVLAPGRKVYIEGSNELWNSGFYQYQHVYNLDFAAYGTSTPGGTSAAADIMSAAWANFLVGWTGAGRSAGDVIKVASGQAAVPSNSTGVAARLNATSSIPDRFAVAGYWGNSDCGITANYNESESHDVSQLLLTTGISTVASRLGSNLAAFQAVNPTAFANVKLVCYEGGPQNNYSASGAATTAQNTVADYWFRHPRMFASYMAYLQSLQAVAGCVLHNHYDLCQAHSISGSTTNYVWGAYTGHAQRPGRGDGSDGLNDNRTSMKYSSGVPAEVQANRANLVSVAGAAFKEWSYLSTPIAILSRARSKIIGVTSAIRGANR